MPISITSLASGQIATFWLEIRNVGYNFNSTQNQNVFQPTARDLLGISSANIKSPLSQSHSSRL